MPLLVPKATAFSLYAFAFVSMIIQGSFKSYTFIITLELKCKGLN